MNNVIRLSESETTAFDKGLTRIINRVHQRAQELADSTGDTSDIYAPDGALIMSVEPRLGVTREADTRAEVHGAAARGAQLATRLGKKLASGVHLALEHDAIPPGDYNDLERLFGKVTPLMVEAYRGAFEGVLK